MNRSNLFVRIFFVLFLFIFSAIPKLLNYQGKLLDDTGLGITATLPMTFQLYSFSSGGTAL